MSRKVCSISESSNSFLAPTLYLKGVYSFSAKINNKFKLSIFLFFYCCPATKKVCINLGLFPKIQTWVVPLANLLKTIIDRMTTIHFKS